MKNKELYYKLSSIIQISELTMNCILCDQKSISEVCQSIECLNISYSLYINNSNVLSNYINKGNDGNEFMFILKLLTKSLEKNNINSIFSASKSDKKPTINSNIDYLDTVKKDTVKLKELIISSNDDKEILNEKNIYDNINSDLYGLLKFIITKSDLHFRLDLELSRIVNITGVYKLEYSASDENNMRFEDKLSKENSTYLFHGSKLHNWFSIIYNGLQIYSGTTKQENGASYGNGIYLSNSIELSNSYCRSNTNFVIGIFEVINAEKYKQTPNIYVVNNVENLRLKYIVNVDKISKKLLADLGYYITKSKRQTHTNLKNYVGIMKNKRLLVEYNKIKKMEQSLEEKNGLSSREFELIESDNINLWNVKLLKIDNDSKLFKDMQTLKIDHILLEIEFTEKYPIEPPMVRVLKPSFVPITGHVTDGGSICYELLTNQGWSPAINMESLLISLKAIISDDGRLNGLENSRYTKTNAISGYNRVLRAHGWK